MTTIVTRSGKGSPLTHVEVDTNFTNLNTNKLEAGAIALGSAATPSISFTGDTNTGIYSPDADQVAVATNGTGRVFVDASGNVGVGTNDTANAFVTLTNQDASLRLNPVTGGASITAVQTGVAFRNLTIASNETIFQTLATERLRITSAGLVGIGTSSPSSVLHCVGSKDAVNFTIGAPLSTVGGGAFANYSQITFANTSGSNSDAAIRAYANLWNAAGAELGFFTSNNSAPVERLRITATGNVGIGTTSPATTLDVNGDVTITDKIIHGGDTNTAIRFPAADTVSVETAATERMRITSGGDVIINGATSEAGARFAVLGGSATTPYFSVESTNTSAFGAIKFLNGNGEIGSISMLSTGVNYNTSSDYRLKENVSAVTDSINRLLQLKPSRFNFIADPDRTVDGFIAHEVQAVVPECVTGEKDAVDADGNPVYQGIDQSKVVPLLTAALQEAIGEIESLKARLTAAGI